MVFAFGLLCLGGGGVLAVRTDRASLSRRRNEIVAGCLLLMGMSLIGWGFAALR